MIIEINPCLFLSIQYNIKNWLLVVIKILILGFIILMLGKKIFYPLFFDLIEMCYIGAYSFAVSATILTVDWVIVLFQYSFFFNKFIYLFLAVLGLRFCARAFSSCSERGPLFIALRGPLTIAASPVAEHRLQTRRLNSCGSRA